ncbi:MAG TPA: hypothetical protein VHE55_18240 [Fimbriimonadaceae bacterium]|nr:hypothetical protein [Fimbriimonadaceae bacterium]
MTIIEAKSFIGSEVELSWRDRKGDELSSRTRVYAADFVPLYGPCLLTDAGEIRLDRVISCVAVQVQKIA